MFTKLLIANRGEIAVRIVRACRDLGIATVAVYSEADREALHVRLADEAFCCGPPPAAESYLDVDRMLEIAAQSGAQAVHPGYGLLSENGAFADRVAAAGLAFCGPSGEIMRGMGDKITSRRSMREAGVPIVPGGLDALDDDGIAAEAERLGYPLMVKASAGGGGRGLRLVQDSGQLAKGLPRARSEALQAFGDDRVYLEQVIPATRHIEVQVLADAHGSVVHLFERECSIQRRHQKVIEEAPANGIDEALRARLGDAAVRAVRSIGYAGAGTVEFLMDGEGHFYFLEMNTRVQVEHPITEAITGVDIVKWQIRVAAGEPLGFSQQDVSMRGHAIEARVYAEDPDRGFLPSPGVIRSYRAPEGPGVRVDAGVRTGDTVTPFYDALIAKLVVWGRDRPEALARLRRAVDEYRVLGIKTTLAFHAEAARHPVFVKGHYDTGFIADHMKEPTAEAAALREQARSAAFALAVLEAHAGADAGDSELVWELQERRGKKTLGEPVELGLRSLGGERYAVREAGRTRELEWRRERGDERSLREGDRRVEAVVDAQAERDFEVLVGTRSHRIAAERVSAVA